MQGRCLEGSMGPLQGSHPSGVTLPLSPGSAFSRPPLLRKSWYRIPPYLEAKVANPLLYL